MNSSTGARGLRLSSVRWLCSWFGRSSQAAAGPDFSLFRQGGSIAALVAEELTGIVRRLASYFAWPRGPLGRIAGRLMARQSLERSSWMVDQLLRVEPSDHVLEVGFGPGAALELLTARATSGFVAGVDPSGVMMAQARRRNRAEIAAGRLELKRAPAEALPYPNRYFTKACAANSFRIWQSQADGLSELHRVLRPGGYIALVVRMHRPGAGRFDPSRYAATEEDLDEITRLLEASEFSGVTTARREFGRETMAALCAIRDPRSAMPEPDRRQRALPLLVGVTGSSARR